MWFRYIVLTSFPVSPTYVSEVFLSVLVAVLVYGRSLEAVAAE